MCNVALCLRVFLNVLYRGRSQNFSKGGGGHTVSNIIVLAFSPRNIVSCFLKKSLTKGGSRAPQDPPSLRPCLLTLVSCFVLVVGADKAQLSLTVTFLFSCISGLCGVNI